MIKQYGTKETATIMVDSQKDIERSAFKTIVNYCNQTYAKDTHPVIMPDVHAGVDCVIGFTAHLKSGIRPGLIGVDIGCGVEARPIKGKLKLSFEEIDKRIRSAVPLGFDLQKKMQRLTREQDEVVSRVGGKDRLEKSFGTLGGGNHFIEIGKDSFNNYYLIVHTGSRNFGNRVARYHMDIAKTEEDNVLKGKLQEDYLHDMYIAQDFANINRDRIISTIFDVCNFEEDKDRKRIKSTHNYISKEDNIIRKGAISARLHDPVIIPMNMGEGCVIGVGLGNDDWNQSFAHGAGRVMSRTEAKKTFTVEQFKKSMTNVWSSCIDEDRLDESPMAYKNSDKVLTSASESIKIIDILDPVYNLKG